MKKKKETRVEEFLRRIKIGVSFGPKPFQVRWQSADGRFVIVTWPGFSCWMGVGLRGHNPTEHWLVDLDRMSLESKSSSKHVAYRDCCVMRHRGRLTNKDRDGMLRLIYNEHGLKQNLKR